MTIQSGTSTANTVVKGGANREKLQSANVD